MIASVLQRRRANRELMETLSGSGSAAAAGHGDGDTTGAAAAASAAGEPDATTDAEPAEVEAHHRSLQLGFPKL